MSGYAARHLSRVSVAEVLHTMALPVLVTPVAPAPEQKAPGVTVAFAAAAVVVFAAAVLFGAATVVLAVVAMALVVGAAGAVVAAAAVVTGASVVAGTLATAVVVGGLVVAALVVTATLVGRAGELTLALANLGTGGLGVEVSGFAIAPTEPRLRTPPAMMPIFTLPLSAFHCAESPVGSLVLGIR